MVYNELKQKLDHATGTKSNKLSNKLSFFKCFEFGINVGSSVQSKMLTFENVYQTASDNDEEIRSLIL